MYESVAGNRSQSYVTTDGQSASVTWCQAAINARDQFFFLLEIFFTHLQVYADRSGRAV
jgi:hypothetical protein